MHYKIRIFLHTFWDTTEYLADKDYKFRNAPWLEKYLNNPQKVEPKKLRTEIYIPIE
ncbi:MAG: GyrI-like domain-containing protein [Bacteroidales bacterium]|nr:GyrI-like domain-containing protein [Bacteroidales bacterium]